MAVIACANYSTQNLILSIVELTFKEINVILCYKNVPILVDILFCKLKFPSPTVFIVFSHMFFDSLSKLGKMYNCIANFAYGSLQDFSLTQICVKLFASKFAPIRVVIHSSTFAELIAHSFCCLRVIDLQ